MCNYIIIIIIIIIIIQDEADERSAKLTKQSNIITVIRKAHKHANQHTHITQSELHIT
jgi:hypothetical protein